MISSSNGELELPRKLVGNLIFIKFTLGLLNQNLMM